MSKRTITEQQLGEVDIKDFDEVLLVTGPDDHSGVGVFTWPRMATLVSPLSEGTVSDLRQLLIIVSDPDDCEIYERVQRAVIARKDGI